MAWVSKGQRVAITQAEVAAERGEDDVLRAMGTDTLRRASHRLAILSQQWSRYESALARIDAVLSERAVGAPYSQQGK